MHAHPEVPVVWLCVLTTAMCILELSVLCLPLQPGSKLFKGMGRISYICPLNSVPSWEPSQ